MRRTLALLALLAAVPAAAEVKPGSFNSASLGRDVSTIVDLPFSYAAGERKYPVLYVLHGLFESSGFWERRGLAGALQQARDKGEVPDFLVVAVDGGNNFFVNAPGGNYEDLVTKDLTAYVESTYRVIPSREGRALMGISMGGYAALRIALKQPELFTAVAAHSAMILEKLPTAEDGARRGQMAAFTRVFGAPIDTALWAASDPLVLAEKADPKKLPALYFDCGTEDRYGLFVGNQDLHDRLEKRGIKHEFGLYPGDHGYEYVRTVLDKSLRFIASQLRSAAAPSPQPSRKGK